MKCERGPLRMWRRTRAGGEADAAYQMDSNDGRKAGVPRMRECDASKARIDTGEWVERLKEVPMNNREGDDGRTRPQERRRRTDDGLKGAYGGGGEGGVWG